MPQAIGNGTTTRSPTERFETPLPDLDHFAHELVAEDVAALHRRDVAVVQVQIRAADCSARDLHDGVARVEDLRDPERLRPGRASCRASSSPSLDTARFLIRVDQAGPAARHSPGPSHSATSPVSGSPFIRCRSSWICCDGSSPKSHAMPLPSAPAGGLYQAYSHLGAAGAGRALEPNRSAVLHVGAFERPPRNPLVLARFEHLASHSTVMPRPLRPPARQRSGQLLDGSRCRMNRGKFSKFFQKAKTSSMGRLMVVTCSTRTPRCIHPSEVVLDRSPPSPSRLAQNTSSAATAATAPIATERRSGSTRRT